MTEQNSKPIHLPILGAVLARLVEGLEVPPAAYRNWPEEWPDFIEKLRDLPPHPAVRRRFIKDILRGHDKEAAILQAMENASPTADLRELLQKVHGIGGLISARDLMRKDFPAPVWAVPGILPAGLGILAGKAKLGKSWLALQMAKAIALGGEVLGTAVEQGPVMYLALEDSEETLKERMLLQGWPEEGDIPVKLLTMRGFPQEVGDLRLGGADKLTWEIENYGYRLTIIDTLSRSITGDQSDIREMTNWLSPLQEVAHKTHSAILMIDHHRKGGMFKSDVVQDILGSTAKGAIADTSLGLYRERYKSLSRLEVTGRRGRERALSLRFENGLWHYLGEVEEDEEGDGLTERQSEITQLLKTNGSMNGSAIARELGLDVSNAHKCLAELVKSGCIKRERQGQAVFYSPNGSTPAGPTNQPSLYNHTLSF